MKPFPKNGRSEFPGECPKGRGRYWQLADMVRAKREAATRGTPGEASGRTQRGAIASTTFTGQQGERAGIARHTGSQTSKLRN